MRSTRTRGKKGSPHRDPDDPPRRRANKQPGHGTYDNDRPPIIHIISRETGEERCWVVGHSDKATCHGILAEAVPPDGTIVYSDEYRSYHGIAPQHATVNHGRHEWARDDDGDGVREVHCNSCEGAGAALRTFLRPFRGVHKANLHCTSRPTKRLSMPSTSHRTGSAVCVGRRRSRRTLIGHEPMYADGMARMQRAGLIAHAIGCVIALADIRIAQGRLREAMRTYERGLQLATAHGEPVLRGTADMEVGMSDLYRERNDLSTATEHLLRSQQLGEHMGLPQNPYRWRVAMARIKQAHGDLDGALELLEDAERRYAADFFPNVRPVAALVTRVWVAQGRLGEALGWAREQALSAQDKLSYLREFEHITLARVLLARAKNERAGHSMHEAIGLLDRLLAAAQAEERTGRVIEILVLQALAHQLQGDIPAALVPLTRALALAEPEGYVRLFVDEGPPMTHLLSAAAAQGMMPGYVEMLLAAFPDFGLRILDFGMAGSIQNPKSKIPNLVEPLSQRELEVLRLFKTELSGPEIARELVIGLSTVRTYTKSIYSKLNVTNRRAAVKRAAELGLI